MSDEKRPHHQYATVHVVCEDCSTIEHPIQMKEVDGIYFRCPLCKKEVCVLVTINNCFSSHYGTDCKRCLELEEKGIVFGEYKRDNLKKQEETYLDENEIPCPGCKRKGGITLLGTEAFKCSFCGYFEDNLVRKHLVRKQRRDKK